MTKKKSTKTSKIVSKKPDAKPPAVTDKPLDAAEQVIREEEALREDLVRMTADIENLKKDIQSQNAESARRATEAAVRALAPAMDALYAASAAMRSESGADLQKWCDGVMSVHDKFTQAMTELGVVPIPTEGSYDPKYHEAIEHVAGEKYAIVDTVSLGWMWKEDDRIIVAAKVRVGSGEESTNE